MKNIEKYQSLLETGEVDALLLTSVYNRLYAAQYRVAEGDVIFVEKLDVEAGEAVKFDRVLAVIDEDKAVFGTPVVENAVVSGNVVKNGKSKKIRVYKMKPKKGYRRTQGHRQPYTKVEITKIEA